MNIYIYIYIIYAIGADLNSVESEKSPKEINQVYNNVLRIFLGYFIYQFIKIII